MLQLLSEAEHDVQEGSRHNEAMRNVIAVDLCQYSIFGKQINQLHKKRLHKLNVADADQIVLGHVQVVMSIVTQTTAQYLADEDVNSRYVGEYDTRFG